MPRPRKVSDDEVFAAAQRVMTRVGPAELTLAGIAEEAGVTAGALVQRFGSRRGLMVAMASLMASGSGEFFRRMRAEHRSPLAVVRAYARCMADLARSPEEAARNFAYFQNDLTDPQLRAPLVEYSRANRRELRALVREAVRAGELSADIDPGALARSVEAVVNGALLTWAIYAEGSAASWLLAHVDAVLAPYLRRGPRRPKGGRRR
jgi:AcrR family transcriptional regulator